MRNLKNSKYTVAIVTPFTDQQRYLTTKITKHPDRIIFENLRLIIKTFDTIQGEEREIVFIQWWIVKISQN